MSAQQLKNGFVQLYKAIFELSKCKEKIILKIFSCTLFCPKGQNELDIKKCDAQIPSILKNLRSPNFVRGNNRLMAVIEDTLIIFIATSQKKRRM